MTAIGRHIPQPRIQEINEFEHARCPCSVLYAGVVSDHADEVADCIHYDLALASLDVLSAIERTRSGGFVVIDRLPVYHTGCGQRRAPGDFPRLHDHDVIDGVERAVATEALEISLYGRERHELLRDLPRLTADSQHIEDGFHNHSHRCSLGLASRSWSGHESLDQALFDIDEAACVVQCSPTISSSSDFTPSHYEFVTC